VPCSRSCIVACRGCLGSSHCLRCEMPVWPVGTTRVQVAQTVDCNRAASHQRRWLRAVSETTWVIINHGAYASVNKG